MKKIFMMLLILFIIYIGIQLGFRFFGSGHEYEYIINNGDKEILMNGKSVFPEPTKGFFIPLDGPYEYYIFINKDENVYSEDYFSPIGGGIYELVENVDIEIIE